MEKNRQEFLGNVCNLYMIVLLAVLPLYTGGTYWRLGDTKYLLFRNVSLICLGIWIAVEGVSLGRRLGKGAMTRKKSAAPKKHGKDFGRVLSMVDWFVLAYGVAALISFLFSPYRQTAWTGYRDWYMGALSQILFVGIYFFVSRNCRQPAYPIYLGEAAFFLVTIIGLLQRLKLDPLRLLADFSPGDWEYTHMLSTMGNINWLCGYYCAVLGLAVTGFLCSKRRWKTAALYVVNVLSLLLLCIQGSTSGVVIALSCIVICLILGLKKAEFFEKGILLSGGAFLLLPVMAGLMTLRKSTATLPGDSNIYEKIGWGGWWLAGAAAFLIYFMMKKMRPQMKGIFIRVSLVAAGVIALVAGIIIFAEAGGFSHGMKWNDSWGTGRGALWRLSWEGFLLSDFLHKLVGVGPDCFAEYIYSVFPAREIIRQSGHWQKSVFTNAHNEWLNTLVNMGVLGVAGYLGIFVSGLKRYRGMLLGIFVIVLYFINSLASFQQTVSTPLFFLILGICESKVRRA